jgi:hypothetical protein
MARVPLYLVERRFAEQLEITDAGVREAKEIHAEEGIRWLYSFLSADQRLSYCLYEAPSPEALEAAAIKAGLPVDVITEVSVVDPAASPG